MTKFLVRSAACAALIILTPYFVLSAAAFVASVINLIITGA